MQVETILVCGKHKKLAWWASCRYSGEKGQALSGDVDAGARIQRAEKGMVRTRHMQKEIKTNLKTLESFFMSESNIITKRNLITKQLTKESLAPKHIKLLKQIFYSMFNFMELLDIYKKKLHS